LLKFDFQLLEKARTKNFLISSVSEKGRQEGRDEGKKEEGKK